MRYIGLLAALAIIYIAYTRSSTVTSGETAITQNMDAANPTAPGASPSPHTDALKAPLDRTRQVLDQVRKQKSDDQF